MSGIAPNITHLPLDTDDGLRRAELSRKLRAPVLKPPHGYKQQVLPPGSCAAVWMHEDGTTVLKSPLAFYLDGCDSAVTKEYKVLEQESVELVEREKKIYSHLGKHAAILQCLEISETGLKFPYMKNGNLRALLHKDLPRTSDHQRQWILTILDAFDFIHGHEVIQGDVSARNVLVTDDLSLVLSDFSGSKFGDKECLVRPETRYEKQTTQPFVISRASDIFAIGSLIYEIVTGKPPYEELDEDEVERRFKRADFPSTADLHLGEIIRGCWTAEYDTARQISDDILMHEEKYMYGATATLSRLWRAWISWWQGA